VFDTWNTDCMQTKPTPVCPLQGFETCATELPPPPPLPMGRPAQWRADQGLDTWDRTPPPPSSVSHDPIRARSLFQCSQE